MPRCGGGGWNPADVLLGASEAGVVGHNEVMSTRRASGGSRQGQGPIMAPLWDRRSRRPSDGKGIWVPRHEACRPPACPVLRSVATKHAETRSR